MRKLKVLLLAVGLVFSGTQCALAHAELVKSFPIANAKLTKAPKFVQLEFGEAIITLKSKNANSIVILDSKSKRMIIRNISNIIHQSIIQCVPQHYGVRQEDSI
jgi:methionine-rich copper-binding protein CopC